MPARKESRTTQPLKDAFPLAAEGGVTNDFRNSAMTVLGQQRIEFAIDAAERARALLDQRRADLDRLRAGEMRDVGVAPAVHAPDRDDIEQRFGLAKVCVHLRE